MWLPGHLLHIPAGHPSALYDVELRMPSGANAPLIAMVSQKLAWTRLAVGMLPALRANGKRRYPPAVSGVPLPPDVRPRALAKECANGGAGTHVWTASDGLNPLWQAFELDGARRHSFRFRAMVPCRPVYVQFLDPATCSTSPVYDQDGAEVENGIIRGVEPQSTCVESPRVIAGKNEQAVPAVLRVVRPLRRHAGPAAGGEGAGTRSAGALQGAGPGRARNSRPRGEPGPARGNGSAARNVRLSSRRQRERRATAPAAPPGRSRSGASGERGRGGRTRLPPGAEW